MVPAWAAGTAKVKIEVNSIASDRAAWLNATPLLTLPLMDALPSDVTPPPDDELLPDPQAVIRKAINVEIRISEADLALPDRPHHLRVVDGVYIGGHSSDPCLECIP